jgi:hypothetical protein
MIQEILTWTTVMGAIAYALYSFWKTLFSKNSAGACGSGCSSCGAKSLLIKDISKTNAQKVSYLKRSFRLN